jgi:hypothetical protein
MAGGGGLITFPLLMLVVGPMTADATSAVAGFASYPTAVADPKSVNRSSGPRMIMASRDPQFSRWIDWSAAIVIVIGLTVTAYYFWKLYNPAVMHVGGNSEVRGNFHSLPSHSKIFDKAGTSRVAKIETCIRKGGSITYENVNRSNGGISFAIQCCCFSWSEPG